MACKYVAGFGDYDGGKFPPALVDSGLGDPAFWIYVLDEERPALAGDLHGGKSIAAPI